MNNKEIGTFWIILGWFLLPFIALHKWIKNTHKEMNKGFRFIFYYFLFIIIIELILLIKDYA